MSSRPTVRTHYKLKMESKKKQQIHRDLRLVFLKKHYSNRATQEVIHFGERHAEGAVDRIHT